MQQREFKPSTEIRIEAAIKAAASRGDWQRVAELRVNRGEDPIAVAADIATQED